MLDVCLTLLEQQHTQAYAGFENVILNFKGIVEGGERSAENGFCLSVKVAVPRMISKCHFSSLEIDNTL